MADIYEFKKHEDTDEHTCEFCELTDEYVTYIKTAIENNEDLAEVVHGLIVDAINAGYMNALNDDINNKIKIMQMINDSVEED